MFSLGVLFSLGVCFRSRPDAAGAAGLRGGAPTGATPGRALGARLFEEIYSREHPSSFCAPSHPPLSCRTSPPQGGRLAGIAASANRQSRRNKGSRRRGRLISTLEGEMSGRTEGGAKRRKPFRIQHTARSALATLPFGPGH